MTSTYALLGIIGVLAAPAALGQVRGEAEPPRRIESQAEQRRIVRVQRVRRERRARFDEIVREVSREYGVRSDIVHALIWVESAYDPDAVSSKGAAGLMQLMPATAERFGVTDRFDPRQNVGAGVAYLRELEKLFPGELELVFAAYNAGEQAVEAHGRRVPPYPETREFVRRVQSVLRSDHSRCWAWEVWSSDDGGGSGCESRRPIEFPGPNRR